MDESAKQNAVPPPTPSGLSLAGVLGRLMAAVVFAGGIVCGLLVLDHHTRAAEGLHTLDLAVVIGIMLFGAALGMLIWLFCAVLSKTTRLGATLERREMEAAAQAVQDRPTIERLQTALDELRELVLLDDKDRAGRRSAIAVMVKERTEQRNRLYSEIQTAAAAKNWTDAIRLSEQLLAEYPASVEAQTVGAKLPTLKANAEISRRQELEQQIKVCVHEQKYPEAVGLARQLIGQYPDSPQAKALVVQLPRLEQLAAITLAILNGTLVVGPPPGGGQSAGTPAMGGPVAPPHIAPPAGAAPGMAETQGK